MKSILLTYADNTANKAYLPEVKNEIREIKRLFNKNNFAEAEDEGLSDVSMVINTIDQNKERLSIFLFSGHASTEGVIVENGNTAFSEGLAAKLKSSECPNLKLVFLNGCSTQGMVDQLFSNGIPIVIYTCSSVEDRTAAKFSVDFFKALSDGRTIKEAFECAGDNIKTNNKKFHIESRKRDTLGPLDTEIGVNRWGCDYFDEKTYETWTLREDDDDERIDYENYTKCVKVAQDSDFKRLEFHRDYLAKLEDNRKKTSEEKNHYEKINKSFNKKNEQSEYEKKIDDFDGKIVEIESLCLHIENEIKKIKLTPKLDEQPLITINKETEYRIRKHIGVGRFSEIYEAERLIHINNKIERQRRKVVLKVFKNNPDIERIRRNIAYFRTFSKFTNSTEIISTSFDNPKLQYYTTEYAGQINLGDYILDAKLKEKENNKNWREKFPFQSRKQKKETKGQEFRNIKKIIEYICDALEELHEKKIAHMDIRPSNIVIKKDNSDRISAVTLIDFDDLVSELNLDYIPHFKSNPYLDRNIIQKEQKEIKDYIQADIYALTLVVLFCIIKEDLMEQNMVKKLHGKNNLTMYINRIYTSKPVRDFLMKGTGCYEKYRYETIKDFYNDFKDIDSFKIKWYEDFYNAFKRNYLAYFLTLLGVIGLLLIVKLTSEKKEVVILNKEKNAQLKSIKEKNLKIKALNIEANELNKKLFFQQDWHLQIPLGSISEQLPYIEDDSKEKDFLNKIEDIVEKIRTPKDSAQLNYSLIATDVKGAPHHFDSLMPQQDIGYNYHGIRGDHETHYFPDHVRVSITQDTEGNILTPDDFNPSAKKIINSLARYLIINTKSLRNEISESSNSEKYKFLNKYLLGNNINDKFHLITLLYLGYVQDKATNGKKTSFMMRYPAYNVSVIYEWDKKTGYIEKRYKLTERDWWKEAMKSTGASKHGLSKPYVDSRENMPQPRTFWYKIRLTNPDATAVLGVDFIFKPIKRPIKRQKKE